MDGSQKLVAVPETVLDADTPTRVDDKQCASNCVDFVESATPDIMSTKQGMTLTSVEHRAGETVALTIEPGVIGVETDPSNPGDAAGVRWTCRMRSS
jgi:hypothetical protein